MSLLSNVELLLATGCGIALILLQDESEGIFLYLRGPRAVPAPPLNCETNQCLQISSIGRRNYCSIQLEIAALEEVEKQRNKLRI